MQTFLVPLGSFSNTRPLLMAFTRLAIAGLAAIFVVSCGHTRQVSSPEPDRGAPASIIDDAETVEVDLAELRIGVNPGDAEVIGTVDRLRVTLKSGILFQSGEATLQPEGESILSELLDVANGTAFDCRSKDIRMTLERRMPISTSHAVVRRRCRPGSVNNMASTAAGSSSLATVKTGLACPMIAMTTVP